MAITTQQQLQVVLRGASIVLAENPAVSAVNIYNLVETGGLVGEGSNVIGPGGIVGYYEQEEAA